MYAQSGQLGSQFCVARLSYKSSLSHSKSWRIHPKNQPKHITFGQQIQTLKYHEMTISNSIKTANNVSILGRFGPDKTGSSSETFSKLGQSAAGPPEVKFNSWISGFVPPSGWWHRVSPDILVRGCTSIIIQEEPPIFFFWWLTSRVDILIYNGCGPRGK